MGDLLASCFVFVRDCFLHPFVDRVLLIFGQNWVPQNRPTDSNFSVLFQSCTAGGGLGGPSARVETPLAPFWFDIASFVSPACSVLLIFQSIRRKDTKTATDVCTLGWQRHSRFAYSHPSLSSVLPSSPAEASTISGWRHRPSGLYNIAKPYQSHASISGHHL